MTDQEIFSMPFEIERHKSHFINYLEVILFEDGHIEYACPSHQEKLISICMREFNCSRQELFDRIPEEYCFDCLEWMCKVTNCVAIWNRFIVGNLNATQIQVLNSLVDAELLDTARF